MNELLKTSQEKTISFLRTRTGFLGLGPSYGQIMLCHVLEYGRQKFEEHTVVREAEKILDEINKRERMF